MDSQGEVARRRVFICHSSKDKKAADVICAALEAADIRCWIAPRDIDFGMKYAAGIMRGIDETEALLLVVSAHSSESEDVRLELQHAQSKGKRLLPVRIESIEPSDDLGFFLNPVQRFDAFPPPVEDHVDRLVTAVRSLLKSRTANAIPLQHDRSRDRPATPRQPVQVLKDSHAIPVGVPTTSSDTKLRPAAIPRPIRSERTRIVPFLGIAVIASVLGWFGKGVFPTRSPSQLGSADGAADRIDSAESRAAAAEKALQSAKSDAEESAKKVGKLIKEGNDARALADRAKDRAENADNEVREATQRVTKAEQDWNAAKKELEAVKGKVGAAEAEATQEKENAREAGVKAQTAERRATKAEKDLDAANKNLETAKSSLKEAQRNAHSAVEDRNRLQQEVDSCQRNIAAAKNGALASIRDFYARRTARVAIETESQYSVEVEYWWLMSDGTWQPPFDAPGAVTSVNPGGTAFDRMGGLVLRVHPRLSNSGWYILEPRISGGDPWWFRIQASGGIGAIHQHR